jgi:hypothetical protein
MIKTRLNYNHRRNGLASGQNRRKTSRTHAAGAASSKPPTLSTGAGASSDLTTSPTTTPIPRPGVGGDPTSFNGVKATAHNSPEAPTCPSRRGRSSWRGGPNRPRRGRPSRPRDHSAFFAEPEDFRDPHVSHLSLSWKPLFQEDNKQFSW